MSNKNFFVEALNPTDEFVFKQNLTWFSVGLSDPSAGGEFELHGCGESAGSVIVMKDQSFTSPENCLMNSEGDGEIKIVNTGATVVNVAYRY